MKSLHELTKNFFDILDLTAASPESADSDEMCFHKALRTFLNGGRKEDAFVVYFCFSEIFKLFGEGYENTKKLLETLSDHEYHSGELLEKHRDHYSHSVYVFALGLAIYANDGEYRRVFNEFYGLSDDGRAACTFLRLWGLVALFHDIGYPFQLAHEQIKTYTNELWRESPDNPFVSFGNLDKFLAIDEKTKEKISDGLRTDRKFDDINALLAYGLKLREGYDEKTVHKKLYDRIVDAPNFMDHGYFSAVILARQLFAAPDFRIDLPRLDVFTAILLHNSFNKYDAPNKHPIAMDEHPLAYLLILCDELQCWDRLAYGKASKRDPIAWDVSFKISNDRISCNYVFDSATIKDENNKTRINKSFGKIQSGEFSGFVGTKEKCKENSDKVFIVSSLVLEADAEEKKKEKRVKLYASDDNFINLCDFAKAIHAGYNERCKKFSGERISEDFAKLPLEFKVSNIEQAKSYAYKLELINCFYSSKDLDYPVIDDFKTSVFGEYGSDNFGFLCREEHLRWVKEKIALGWKYGEEGVDYHSIEERNRLKLHKCLVPYELLSDENKSKDELMIENIIPMLKKLGNNIHVYNYRMGRKPDLVIGGIGHRFFKEKPSDLKSKIIKILKDYDRDYRVIVLTGYAYGADQLIAECANELGLTTKAALPMEYDDYLKFVKQDALEHHVNYTADDEMRLRLLLAQTVVCNVIPDYMSVYNSTSQYIIKRCDKLIAIWDGDELDLFDENRQPKNRGCTYHGVWQARNERGFKDGENLLLVKCHR